MKHMAEKYYPYLLALLAGLFLLPFLGKVHLFDWDEINFAESAREMLVTGDYLRVRVGFLPFWEKPPFFFWLQAASMHIFGVNEFAARFPNAMFGAITLVTLYVIGKKEKNARFGLLWSLLYFSSLLPHLYFKSGIIDPVFNYFIFTAVYFLLKTSRHDAHRMRNATIAGVLIGLAVITKGPVGFLLLLLTYLVVLVLEKFKELPRMKDVAVFALAAFAVSFMWYGVEVLAHGPWFLVEFIRYQIGLFSQPVAGHAQPFYYHFVVVLVGCFPMSVFGIGGLARQAGADYLGRWMKALFWVVMILFTLVTTKIIHYSSMAYFPLSYLAARYVYHKATRQSKPGKAMMAGYIFVGLVLGLALTALPLVVYFIDDIKPFIHDPFAVAGLSAPVSWSGYACLVGVLFILAVVISAILLARAGIIKALGVMGAGLVVSLLLFSAFILPKIEQHTQGPLINFLVSVQGEDVYVTTSGFHSYAPFFYFRQPDDNLDKRADKAWLATGKIDKPVYIITKITDTYIASLPDVELIKEEGGYRFYKRQPEEQDGPENSGPNH